MRQTTYLLAGAALALGLTTGAAAIAQPVTPAAPAAPTAAKGESTQIIRTSEDGVTHETRIVRDASGRTTITRDGKTTVVDPQQIAENVRTQVQNAVYVANWGGHRDMTEHLRNALQLKPGQEAALKAYVEAMHPQRRELTKAEDPMAPRTTPERLALMQKHLDEHNAMVRGQIEATKRFYDQLDAPQKKAFDELHMSASMGPLHLVTFHDGAMPPMPAMPPHMPHPPAPPAPSL